MDPPTRKAPPDVGRKATGGGSPWSECIVEECGTEACTTVEVWVLRGEHVKRFKTFLELRRIALFMLVHEGSIRGFQQAGPATFLPDPEPSATYQQVQMTSTTGTVATCRERKVDASLMCAECARLILGGPYGARGVAVQAYPPQREVTGCLALSRFLPDPLSKDASSTPDSTGNWSPTAPREIAFCNTVRAEL